MLVITTIVSFIWRYRFVAILAKELGDRYAFLKAKSEIEKKYLQMLIEMLINIGVLLLITLVLPLILESSTIKVLLVSYYLASISWGILHIIPHINCMIEGKFIPNNILICLIEKQTGFWTNLLFGKHIREAIIPTIIYMLVISIIYVVLFRFLALPYFVESSTGMGIFELIWSSVYLPIKELISYIF